MANKDLIIESDIPLEHKVQGLLMCVAQEQKVEMTRLIKPFGISLLQLQLLHTLSFAPDGMLTVNQLKSFMLDESPNVSRTLNKLAENDLITKTRSEEDQRTVYISITKQGRDVHIAADKALLSTKLDLTEKELEQLYKLLIKL